MSDENQKTIVVNLTISRLGAAAIAMIILTAALLGYLALARRHARAGGEASSRAASASLVSLRKYYLTATSATSLNTVDACGAGYHFASLWEIMDPSNLAYASDHPNAYVGEADQGSGPPSGSGGAPRYGWVRTGQNASIANTAGTGNCQNWTSDEATEFGSRSGLNPNWTSAEDVFVWKVSTAACNTSQPVWCIED